jgi:hypothetical protein
VAESFDAVLADIRETAKVGHAVESRGMAFAADPSWLDDWADRLAAAHEAEVAERDRAVRQANSQTEHFERQYYLESDRADRAVGLLRDYRMAPKFSHDHAAIKRTVALEDEIDAFLSGQAGERENGDG